MKNEQTKHEVGNGLSPEAIGSVRATIFSPFEQVYRKERPPTPYKFFFQPVDWRNDWNFLTRLSSQYGDSNHLSGDKSSPLILKLWHFRGAGSSAVTKLSFGLGANGRA
jgi:hypothetical protein